MRQKGSGGKLGTFDLKQIKINVTQTVNSAVSPPLNELKKVLRQSAGKKNTVDIFLISASQQMNKITAIKCLFRLRLADSDRQDW